MSKKRNIEPEKENKERWLLTYSDLITLLCVFFIVMYTLSKIDAKKYEAIAQSLSKAMGGSSTIMPNSGANLTQGNIESNISAAMDKKEQASLEKLRQQIQSYLDKNGLNGQVSVSLEDRGVVVSFPDMVLFDLGSAALTPHAQDMITSVGKFLNQVPNYVRVEGHTDNLPISTAQFPSNWELSEARANSVVRQLITDNIKPERLSATGYGEYRPSVPNDNEADRQRNRRVDITVLRNKYDTAEPAAGGAVSTAVKN